MAKKVGRASGGKKGEARGAMKKGMKKKGAGGGKGPAKSRRNKGAKGKGKGQGKGKAAAEKKTDGRGVKRSRAEEEPEKEAPVDKKGNVLTKKKVAKKEETKLYSELLNQGRDRKAEAVVADILDLLESRGAALVDYCCKKLGSRVVQACLKWGVRAQRDRVLKMLKEHILRLAGDRYGHVLVLKLLKYTAHTAVARKPTEAEKAASRKNIKEFMEPFQSSKNLHALFFQKYGCTVINGLYLSDTIDAKEKRRILHTVAVPQAVALLRPELPGSMPLRKLCTSEDMTAEQRTAVREHLRDASEKCVDKELLNQEVVHLLFQAFCDIATESQLKDLAEKSMAGAPYLLSSKPGAEALIKLLGHASAKLRKNLLRDLKGKFVALATNSVDYVAMMRLAATVDDTKLLGASMLKEWTEDMEEICFDKYGHKSLAWIFRPDDAHYFSPYERGMLALPAPASLKAPETRRQEIARVLRPAVRNVLVADPLKAASDVCAKNLLTAYLADDWDADLVEALLKAAEGAAGEAGLGALGSGTATTALLVLLKLEPEGTKAPFALPLFNRCLKPHFEAVATSRGAFLLLGMLKAGGKVQEAVLSELRSRKGKLAAAVKSAEAKGEQVHGAKQLLEAMTGAKTA